MKPEAVKPDTVKPDTAKPEATKPDMPREQKSTTIPSTPVPEPERRSTFLPLVLGGVVAGLIGYGVSEFNLLGTRGQDNSLQQAVSAQEGRLSALETAEIPALEIPEIDVLTGQVGQISEELIGLTTQMSDIDARLTTVEKQPITNGTSEAAVAAYERELEALQASVEKQRAEIEGMLENVLSVEQATAEATQAANLQAALTKITTAINAGQPFGDAVSELEALGMSDVPAALRENAQSGVATLISLQTRFPETARVTLSAARAEGEVENEGGVGGFLRRQLGARSVAPREGSDPDAVLSRAEAAMRDGQLETALNEIDALPQGAQAAMQEWLDDARARQATQAAAQDLSESLSVN